MKRLIPAFMACTLLLAAVQGAPASDPPPDTGQRMCEKASQPGPSFTLWLKFEKSDFATIEYFEAIAVAPRSPVVPVSVPCPRVPLRVVSQRGDDLAVYRDCHPVLYERPPCARATG